jgi:hypothetical protein
MNTTTITTAAHVHTVGGSLEDIAQATGYVIEFETGERLYVASLDQTAVFAYCDRLDAEGREVAHGRLAIKIGDRYTVLA